MDLAHLYTSFDGRINRAKAWLWWIVLVVVVAALSFATLRVSAADIFMPDQRTKGFLFVIQLAALYPWAALMVKRFHDRNRPGYFVMFMLVPVVIKGATDLLGITGDPFNQNALDYVFLAIFVVVAVWFFVELGCLRGSVGPNQYGPDPLGG
jgi:uncharacterized membrane protein YhaH (DUF805 family)